MNGVTMGCLGWVLVVSGTPGFGQARDPLLLPEERGLAPVPERLPEREPEKLLHFQVEFIEVSHATLTELMFLRDPKANAMELRVELQDLVKDAKAEVVETMMCVARPGQRAKSEVVREFMYPTEYDPPEIPHTVHLGGAKQDGSGEEEIPRVMTPATPTAFDIRNEGSTLEVDAHLGADGYIEASIAPEMVEHTGNVSWMEIRGPRGECNKVEMPLFYTAKLYASLVMRDGQYTIAGLVSPRDAEGTIDRSRKLIVFAKCDVVPVQK